MTDRVSKKVRSSIMSKIRSKNTKCELVLFKALEDAGIKNFKRHYAITGKPDVALPEKKLAVFCDSGFWHGKGRIPETNAEYWRKKFERNRKRDKEVNRELRRLGWNVLRISEENVLNKTELCVLQIKKY
jgi:DNA mismatch endonuclease (patch repair protein)